MRYSVVQPRVVSKEPGNAPVAGAAPVAEPPMGGVPNVSVPRSGSERPAPPKSKPRVSATPRAPSPLSQAPPKSKAPGSAAARGRSLASPASAAKAAATVPASPTAVRVPAAPAVTFPAPPTGSASESVADSITETDLVVTVAPSDWNLPSRDALVGHGAVRVAIAPGRGSGGTLMVRPLKPGEVAPRGSTVAVLVALEPGAPLPRV